MELANNELLLVVYATEGLSDWLLKHIPEQPSTDVKHVHSLAHPFVCLLHLCVGAAGIGGEPQRESGYGVFC